MHKALPSCLSMTLTASHLDMFASLMSGGCTEICSQVGAIPLAYWHL